MALPRSHAAIWLRTKAKPKCLALFSQTSSPGASQAISQVALLFVARRLDSALRLTSSPDLQSPAVRVIVKARCRKSSSIIQASAFHSNPEFLEQWCAILDFRCFVG